MRRNFAFSVTDEGLILAIEKFKQEGGNLSGLIVRLLENYFFGDNNKIITKEMLTLLEIKKKLDDWDKWRQEIIPKIQELEKKLNEKQEAKETEENLPLIRELREIVFEDLQDYGRFESQCQKVGRKPEDAIKARLAAWAVEKKISYPEAVNLFFKAFPQLKHLFERMVISELKDKLEGRL